MKIHRMSCVKQQSGLNEGEYMGSVTIHAWVPYKMGPMAHLSIMNWTRAGNTEDTDCVLQLVVETGSGFDSEPEKAMHKALNEATKRVTGRLHDSLVIGVEVTLKVQ